MQVRTYSGKVINMFCGSELLNLIKYQLCGNFFTGKVMKPSFLLLPKKIVLRIHQGLFRQHLIHLFSGKESSLKNTIMQETLREYLLRNGVNESTPSYQIDNLKKAYEKQYLKTYQKDYRKKNKRVELTLSSKEHQKIQRASKGAKMATFIKSAVFAYLDKKYVIPDNEKVQRLELGIRNLGNLLQQLVDDCPSSMSQADFDFLRQKINGLEDMMSTSFRNPKEVLDFIHQQIQQTPSLKVAIAQLVNRQ